MLLFCAKCLVLNGWMGGWVDRWMDGWIDGWMDGWMEVEASLGIDYSNQKVSLV